MLADRKLVPDYRWTFNFFAKLQLKALGRINSPEAFQLSKERVQAYNEKHNGQVLAKMEQLESGDFIVCIVDELAIRAHQCLPSAGDIMMMDDGCYRIY